MVNINLFKRREDQESLKETSLKKSFFISLLPLLIIILIYGGIKMWSKSLESQKALLEEEIASMSIGLTNQDVNQVADFQRRIEDIDANLKEKKSPLGVLNWLERNIVANVTAENLKLTENGFKLEMKTNNFTTAAKQIHVFKKSDALQSDKLTSLSRNENGDIVFGLEINLKDSKN